MNDGGESLSCLTTYCKDTLKRLSNTQTITIHKSPERDQAHGSLPKVGNHGGSKQKQVFAAPHHFISFLVNQANFTSLLDLTVGQARKKGTWGF
jgi:hypothetical protein